MKEEKRKRNSRSKNRKKRVRKRTGLRRLIIPARQNRSVSPCKSRRIDSKILMETRRKISYPKRAMSSFLYYFHENLPSMRGEKKMKITEAAKLLGERWRQLDQKIKDNYINRSRDDWKRYRTEKSALPAAMASPAKYFRRQCKPHLPKRVTSSFIFYYKEMHSDQRAKSPALKTSEVAICLGKKWKHLKKEEKEKYVQMANQDRERYQREKRELAHLKPTEPPNKRQKLQNGEKIKDGNSEESSEYTEESSENIEESSEIELSSVKENADRDNRNKDQSLTSEVNLAEWLVVLVFLLVMFRTGCSLAK